MSCCEPNLCEWCSAPADNYLRDAQRKQRMSCDDCFGQLRKAVGLSDECVVCGGDMMPDDSDDTTCWMCREDEACFGSDESEEA